MDASNFMPVPGARMDNSSMSGAGPQAQKLPLTYNTTTTGIIDTSPLKSQLHQAASIQRSQDRQSAVRQTIFSAISQVNQDSHITKDNLDSLADTLEDGIHTVVSNVPAMSDRQLELAFFSEALFFASEQPTEPKTQASGGHLTSSSPSTLPSAETSEPRPRSPRSILPPSLPSTLASTSNSRLLVKKIIIKNITRPVDPSKHETFGELAVAISSPETKVSISDLTDTPPTRKANQDLNSLQHFLGNMTQYFISARSGTSSTPQNEALKLKEAQEKIRQLLNLFIQVDQQTLLAQLKTRLSFAIANNLAPGTQSSGGASEVDAFLAPLTQKAANNTMHEPLLTEAEHAHLLHIHHHNQAGAILSPAGATGAPTMTTTASATPGGATPAGTTPPAQTASTIPAASTLAAASGTTTAPATPSSTTSSAAAAPTPRTAQTQPTSTTASATPPGTTSSAAGATGTQPVVSQPKPSSSRAVNSKPSNPTAVELRASSTRVQTLSKGIKRTLDGIERLAPNVQDNAVYKFVDFVDTITNHLPTIIDFVERQQITDPAYTAEHLDIYLSGLETILANIQEVVNQPFDTRENILAFRKIQGYLETASVNLPQPADEASTDPSTPMPNHMLLDQMYLLGARLESVAADISSGQKPALNTFKDIFYQYYSTHTKLLASPFGPNHNPDYHQTLNGLILLANEVELQTQNAAIQAFTSSVTKFAEAASKFASMGVYHSKDTLTELSDTLKLIRDGINLDEAKIASALTQDDQSLTPTQTIDVATNTLKQSFYYYTQQHDLTDIQHLLHKPRRYHHQSKQGKSHSRTQSNAFDHVERAMRSLYENLGERFGIGAAN